MQETETKDPSPILLVDDRPENLTALTAVLAELGENLVTAGSGAEALRRVLDTDFAVILLDVQMPGMDGFETATLIRRRGRNLHTPIIFLTAVVKEEPEVFRGYAAGAVDYLIKPFDPEILRSKVRVFTDLFRYRLAVERQAAQLARYSTRLEKEVAERQRAEERLEHLNRELEAFSYSVSHDLRAPLRIIESFSRALAEDCAGRLDGEAKRHLERIQTGVRRMEALITDILQLSQVGRAELRRETTDLTALASGIAAALREAAPGRAAEFVIQPGLKAAGDPALLRIVLENLLGNAWKYTGRSPRTRIEFGAIGETAAGQGGTTFFVRDNGTGFPAEKAGELFQPFRRLHSAGEFEGTGVGLATVQRIIRRHGGTCRAEGAPNQGATFFFTLIG